MKFHRAAAVAALASATVAGVALVAQRAVSRPGPLPTVVWKVDAPAYGRAAADTALAFFLSGRHEITAVNARTGAIQWKRHSGEADPVVGAGITLAGQTVVAGDYNITAYDRTSGALRWRFVPAEGFGPGAYLGPTVTAGAVFTGSAAGRIYAVDLASGTSRWMVAIAPSTPQQRILVLEPAVDAEIVAAGYTTMTAPTTGGVVVLDTNTGEERWRVEFPPSENPLVGVGGGTPVLVDDLVIVASRDGLVRAFRRSDGALQWTIPPLDRQPLPGPGPIVVPNGPSADFRALASAGRTLFVGSSTGYVIAYDIDTRRERWRHIGHENGSIGFQMTSDGTAVYFPSWSGRLTAVDVAKGFERWRIGDYTQNFLWPPAVVGDVVYAGSAAGFHALRR